MLYVARPALVCVGVQCSEENCDFGLIMANLVLWSRVMCPIRISK